MEGHGAILPVHGRLYRFHRMGKGQEIAEGPENTSDHIQAEPSTAQPRREVDQDRGSPAHLRRGEETAEQEPERDEQHGRDQQHGKAGQQIHADRKPEEQRRNIADYSLQKGQGQHGQGIAEDVVRPRHGAGKQAHEKGAGAVIRDQHAEEQGQEGEPEHGHPRREGRNAKHLGRHLRDAALHHRDQ